MCVISGMSKLDCFHRRTMHRMITHYYDLSTSSPSQPYHLMRTLRFRRSFHGGLRLGVSLRPRPLQGSTYDSGPCVIRSPSPSLFVRMTLADRATSVLMMTCVDPVHIHAQCERIPTQPNSSPSVPPNPHRREFAQSQRTKASQIRSESSQRVPNRTN